MGPSWVRSQKRLWGYLHAEIVIYALRISVREKHSIRVRLCIVGAAGRMSSAADFVFRFQNKA